MNEFLVGIGTSLISSLVAFGAGIVWSARYRVANFAWRRGVALVVGSRDDVTITYGGRGVAGSEENTARTGDVESLVALSSTVERYRGEGRSRIRIASPATPPSRGSEILIGGPNANPRARTALRTTLGLGSSPTPLVQVVASNNTYNLKIEGDVFKLRRTSGAIVQDYGVILSTPHPMDETQRLTLVFGLKTYGTLGAARFIDTPSFKSATRGFHRDASFCIVVSVPIDDEIAGPATLAKVFP